MGLQINPIEKGVKVCNEYSVSETFVSKTWGEYETLTCQIQAQEQTSHLETTISWSILNVLTTLGSKFFDMGAFQNQSF